jgi:hypothetical protein
MVEANMFQPGNFFMALVAFDSLLALMDVVLLMAAVAVGIYFLGAGAEVVAGLAGQAVVGAVEREIGICAMIEPFNSLCGSSSRWQL